MARERVSARSVEEITLLAGTDFVLCDPDGALTSDVHGYYVGDTRIVSQLAVLFDGRALDTLRHEVGGNELWVLGTVGDPVAPHVLVQKWLTLTDRLHLRFRLENLTDAAVEVALVVTVSSDFADIFDVKRGHAPSAGFVGSGPLGGALHLTYESDGFRRGVTVRSEPPAAVSREGLSVRLAVPGRGVTEAVVELAPEPASQRARLSAEAASGQWRPADPELTSSWGPLETGWHRACIDLRSLLLSDPAAPARTIVAAGSPWYMALFGRDSLLTSWEALPLGPGLAIGTVAALAARQGTTTNTISDEQPGRIPHEVRSGEAVRRPDGWGEIYYGSVDATPLFVMTLAEAWRWGADRDAVAALLPAAERAVEWLCSTGDPDGDGFVEYPGVPREGPGLVNQGWKDSQDAIRHTDGRLADGPIALVEVQGYCHAALVALAALRASFHSADPEPLLERAEALGRAIDASFWMDDERCFALALDGDKEPVRSVTSNAGHLLWTGSVLEHRRGPLAARLMEDDLFTGFGLRTLSSTNPGFNPLSYHCGSVWPHDTALVAAGMFRSGEADAGWRLAAGLLDVAAPAGGRLPELFGGFDRAQFPFAVPYPTSCSPQAWAATAPLLLARALIGVEPDLPNAVVHLDPAVPEGVTVELRGMPLAGGHLDLRCTGRSLELLAVPPGVEVLVGTGTRTARR